MEEELDELLEAALAPSITRIECVLEENEQTNGMKASYMVHWKNNGSSVSYMLHLCENGTEIWTEKAECVIQYEIVREITKGNAYKFFMTPVDNPELRSGIVTLPSENILQLEKMTAEEDNRIVLDYALTEGVDRIYVQLSNELKGVCRNVELTPYEKVICLDSYGLSGVEELVCKVSLLTKSGNTEIYQRMADKEAVLVDMRTPLFDSAGFEEQQGSLAGSLLLKEKSPWSTASKCLLYYVYKERTWKQEELAITESGRISLQLSGEAYTDGNLLGVAVRMKEGRGISRLSHMVPLVFGQPELLRGEFCSRQQYQIWLAGDEKEFLWKKIIITRKNGVTEDWFQGNTYIFPVGDALGAAIQYGNGISVGKETSVPITDSIYLDDGENGLLWSGSSPICEKKAIEMTVSLQREPEQAVRSAYFRLEKKASGVVLSMDEKVWQQDDASALELRKDYQEFLKKLDGAVEVQDVYMLRSMVADRLPQHLADMAFYAFGFCDNGMDVLPEMELSVEYSTYQRVDVTDDMEYFNGFAGAHREYYPVLWRDGKFTMDTFAFLLSDGAYVSNATQPDANNEAKAVGGAGGMDLVAPATRKAFARILYPEVFPDREGQGEAISVQNEVLSFADSYTGLLLAADEFCSKAYSSQAYFMHFRGRAHIAPVLSIWLNGQLLKVPVMTLLGDLAKRFRWNLKYVYLIRHGSRLDGRLIQNMAVMEGFLLRAGDEIWLREK